MEIQNKQLNNTKCPPPLMSLNLKPISSKNDETRQKFIQKAKEFKGNTNDEISQKYHLIEDDNPDAKIELEGEGNQRVEVNKEDKFKCPRCEGWIFNAQKISHQNSHSSQILEWLYLGAERNANNHKELTVRTNINMILNTATEVQNYYPEQFEYMKIDLFDSVSQDLLPYFEQGIEYIKTAKDNNKRILVHCIQGISRSASFVLAYLMKHEKMTLKEAFQLVKSKRSIARPNPKFVESLLKFEQQLYQTNSITADEINPLSKFVIARQEEEYSVFVDNLIQKNMLMNHHKE
ncbi:hypothetical protein PPERSA_03822 [Pseudocohnilembus persalinus]|uniref:protein-serine/threonine phosphatase n=1 Tax=Pseudocohnilembus persalinus TaxID=266149 RepID=A0A0V0QUW0_PSEPJ|nr:hypothetical protein PPERSA_03822 [Pseudocohnilembus persalinus]|eukprot:KRX05885.1 hypothetical protein PPERSA_03822 [Pseudocohnilembus persalinus]